MAGVRPGSGWFSNWAFQRAAVLPVVLCIGAAGWLQIATSVQLGVSPQPIGGLIPVLAVLAAVVVAGAYAAILVVRLQRRAAPIPVRAAVARTPAPQRLWNADAPGRPRSRAPGGSCFRDLD